MLPGTVTDTYVLCKETFSKYDVFVYCISYFTRYLKVAMKTRPDIRYRISGVRLLHWPDIRQNHYSES
jgi:hypothetical protein